MEITVETVQGNVPVTVIQPNGNIDGTSYMTLIETAQALYGAGARYMLLDLSHAPYMSSAGLVALRSIARLLCGREPLDTEDGWGAFHTVGTDQSAEHRPFFKLLNPQPQVQKALNMVGFGEYFDIFDDREKALQSFASL